MALLEIKKFPDSVLKKKCKSLKKIDAETKKLVSAMLSVLYQNKGIGLAAPQIGISERIIVCDIGEGPLILINPKISGRKGTAVAEEGCLSFPGVFLEIKRAKEITAKALNLEGKEIRIKAENLLARVLQHEIDHLDGVLFIDRINFWERKKVLKQFKT